MLSSKVPGAERHSGFKPSRQFATFRDFPGLSGGSWPKKVGLATRVSRHNRLVIQVLRLANPPSWPNFGRALDGALKEGHPESTCANQAPIVHVRRCTFPFRHAGAPKSQKKHFRRREFNLCCCNVTLISEQRRRNDSQRVATTCNKPATMTYPGWRCAYPGL